MKIFVLSKPGEATALLGNSLEAFHGKSLGDDKIIFFKNLGKTK